MQTVLLFKFYFRAWRHMGGFQIVQLCLETAFYSACSYNFFPRGSKTAEL